VDGLDTNLKLVNVVQSVEDSEDINSVLLSLLAEVVDCIVWQRGVCNSVGATQEHLEWDVGDELSHLSQPVPGILVEETHSNVEGGSTPALKTVEVAVSMASLSGNVQEVNCAHTSSQEGLMGVTPRRVHEKAPLILPDGCGKSFGAFLNKNVSPALGGRYTSINLRSRFVKEFWHDDVAFELGLSNLSFDAATVDCKVSQVRQQLLATVLATNQVEELGSIIDKSGPAGAFDERGMGQ
jgi:hypothetical protein